MASAEHWLLEPAFIHPRRQNVKSEGRNKARYGIDQVVSLNVYRRTAQKHVERHQTREKPTAATPRHNHQNGRNAYMRRRESGGRTFANPLRALYEVIEKAMFVARTGQQLLIVIEIVANSRKNSLKGIVHTDSRKIELRPCYRHKNVEEIVKEKGRNDDERYFSNRSKR